MTVSSASGMSIESEDLMIRSKRHIMDTYRRYPLVLSRGQGTRVWDVDGKEYIDFIAGIAVCSLGHCHPQVVAAIKNQADRLMHVSNLFYTAPQIRLAEMLVERSFAKKVFFCNSGAEANEGAIKLARRYAHDRYGGARYEIITLEQSFHGRTLATVTATAQAKYHKGFDPLPGGFRYAPFDDLEGLRRSVSEKTCAVLVEPIQGEGGVRVPAEGYLKGLREICDEHGLLLIFDEVQTGVGRTGTLFAYEQSGIAPDIMTLAKALGNGFPVGAVLAREEAAASFVPGTHASTFGGNPLAMAAGMAVIDAIEAEGILEHVATVGRYFMDRLKELSKSHPAIQDVRGRGLLIGLEVDCDAQDIVKKALERGLLITCTSDRVIRFVPPLVVTQNDVDKVLEILDEVMSDR